MFQLIINFARSIGGRLERLRVAFIAARCAVVVGAVLNLPIVVRGTTHISFSQKIESERARSDITEAPA